MALPDRDGDGQADETIVVGEGYDAAHSLAFEADGSLLVAGSGTLYRLTLDDGFHEVEPRGAGDVPARWAAQHAHGRTWYRTAPSS